MSLWQSYLRSSPRTKALLGAAVLAWGAVGMATSDAAESVFGLTPTQDDERRLQRDVDKYVPKISTVDRSDLPPK